MFNFVFNFLKPKILVSILGLENKNLNWNWSICIKYYYVQNISEDSTTSLVIREAPDNIWPKFEPYQTYVFLYIKLKQKTIFSSLVTLVAT